MHEQSRICVNLQPPEVPQNEKFYMPTNTKTSPHCAVNWILFPMWRLMISQTLHPVPTIYTFNIPDSKCVIVYLQLIGIAMSSGPLPCHILSFNRQPVELGHFLPPPSIGSAHSFIYCGSIMLIALCEVIFFVCDVRETRNESQCAVMTLIMCLGVVVNI